MFFDFFFNKKQPTKQKQPKTETVRVCLVTVFFPLFSVFKNNFLFLRLKTYLATQNGYKTKTVFKTQFVKKTENMQKAVFSF